MDCWLLRLPVVQSALRPTLDMIKCPDSSPCQPTSSQLYLQQSSPHVSDLIQKGHSGLLIHRQLQSSVHLPDRQPLLSPTADSVMLPNVTAISGFGLICQPPTCSHTRSRHHLCIPQYLSSSSSLQCKHLLPQATCIAAASLAAAAT